MPLNKQKGNMYGFVSHTWNPIKGRCLHDCSYCYMHRFWNMMKDDKLRLDEKELKTNLGEGNFIFVGSSTDMWIDTPKSTIDKLGWTDWIDDILVHTGNYPKNKYLYQTKNPKGFEMWEFRANEILGITLETNWAVNSRAPAPMVRAWEFVKIKHPRKMVTIEPIMEFDLLQLVKIIKEINPEWVNIGADSGHNNLPEPSKEKVLELITELEKFTRVNQKPNLKRLL